MYFRERGIAFIIRGSLISAMIAAIMVSVVAPELLAGRRKPKTAEEMLFYGIDLYQEGQMEDAMEMFMEVMRMGPSPEEAAIAREYTDRISYRLAGRSPDKKVEQSTATAKTSPAPAKNSDNVPISSSTAKSAPPKETPKSEVPALAPDEPPKTSPVVAPAPEALVEYVRLKLGNHRKKLIEKFKKFAQLGLVLRGTDKLLAVSIPEEMIFSKGASFRKDTAEFLKLLAEASYYHPKHVIRVYPGFKKGRSSIENLQRATVMGSYLTGRGVAPSRIEVDLDGSPKFYFGRDTAVPPALDLMSRNREGQILLVFEDFSDPMQTQYYFTKYLPTHNTSKEFSTLVLGVSRDKIDARVGEGMVIELYANSYPAAIAQWNLRLMSPDGSAVWAFEGNGPVLESFYFEGKKDAVADFEMLLSGRYTLEAQALSVTGGKIRSVKAIDVLGKEPPKAPKVDVPKKTTATPAPAAAKASSKTKTAVKTGAQSKPASKSKKTASAPVGAGTSASGVKAKPADQTANAAAAPETGPSSGKTETMEKAKGTLPPTTLTNFKISFSLNDASVSKNQLTMIAELGQTAKMHPSQRLNLIGYASTQERDPEQLAQARAQAVAKLLTAEYEVAGSRLNVESGLGDGDQRYVEVFVEQ